MRSTLFRLVVVASLPACWDSQEHPTTLRGHGTLRRARSSSSSACWSRTPRPTPFTALIDFIGVFHYTTRETISANGRYHFDLHQNLQGVKGVGQTSSQTFREVGASSFKGNAADFEGTPPFEFSSIAHGAFVGPGPDNNFTLKITSHFVVNANGDLTVAISRVETECR